MRLEIDAGNTSIKWRLVDLEGKVVRRGVTDTNTDVGTGIAINDYLDRISCALISDVSSSALDASIEKLLTPGISRDRFFVARSLPVMGGVTFSYDDVSRLGVDRCLAMVAAYRLFPDGVMVIDCGSAITADIVSTEGTHLGGYILPGISLLKESLLKGTAQVIMKTITDCSFPPDYSIGLGRSTETCVENGIYLMICSTFSSLQDIAREHGIHNIVLTGGDGERVISITGFELAYQRDLVFDGLGILNPF